MEIHKLGKESTAAVAGSHRVIVFSKFPFILAVVMQPLAIVFYERLMPGSQLVNRLQDMNYRVLTLNNIERLTATVQRESPLLLFMDLAAAGKLCAAIASLKAEPATAHLPIIAFAPDSAAALLGEAQAAGALAVGETVVINHLSHLIEQALHVD